MLRCRRRLRQLLASACHGRCSSITLTVVIILSPVFLLAVCLHHRAPAAATKGAAASAVSQCRPSDIAVAPWRRWPRRVSTFLPSDTPHLPSLLRHHRQLQPPHPVRATFPVPSPPVSSQPPTTLLALVKSAPANAAARRAVRDSWGGRAHWPAGFALRFIVGSPATAQLLEEAAAYGDVIVHGEGDGYRNNTRKLLAGLAWAAGLSHLRLLLLTDDDLLVNPFATRPLAEAALAWIGRGGEGEGGGSASSSRQVLAGHLVTGARPIRPSSGQTGQRRPTSDSACNSRSSRSHKWSLSEAEYPYDRYPDYLSAGWLLVSPGLLPDLLWAAGHVTPRLPFDDVYLGLLAARLRLPLTSLQGLLDMGTTAADSPGGSSGIRPLERLLARHGYAGQEERMRHDWQRLVRLHCGGGDLS